MIIAIASEGNHVKAVISQHFGRCNWYCLADTDTLQTRFIENNFKNHPEKAGREAAEWLTGEGIAIAVAGRFGSKVVDAFKSNGVGMVIPDMPKTVAEILNLITKQS
jgi:predicted Fe-Mo cluster-binding NifX family protein